MRCSALALGAGVLALALTAGPAAADPGVGQTVEGSTGAAQIGAVAVDAPVRVASDGDNATTGASVGGPQTTGDSTGSAQVTSVDASAPVRVLSDGNNTQDAGTASGTQTVDGSTGSAQVGSPMLFASVRVLSGGTTPGDEPGSPDVGDAAGDLLGTLLRSPSDGGGGDVVASLAMVLAPAPRGGGSPSPEELRRLLDGADPDPAIRFASGGIGDSSRAAEVHTLGVSASSLPLTGFGFVTSALLGMWLFSTGLALRLVPGGKRR
jgi:hypothetical protein